MMPYLLIAALIGGLLMYLLCDLAKYPKAAEVGRLLFFAAVVALLIALAPATVAKLHS